MSASPPLHSAIGGIETPSTTSSIDRLVHVSVPDKPKYTKRKPDALARVSSISTGPAGANAVVVVSGDGHTPASASASPNDHLSAVLHQATNNNNSISTGGGGGAFTSACATTTSSSSSPTAATKANGEIEAYSPSHFQGGILSPVYTGGAEVVYDPSNVPLPQAAKRLAVDAALRDTPVMQPPPATDADLDLNNMFE